MIKKTVTYTDYNGVERTESYYFNLSKAELTEMELGTTGGLADTLQKIIDSNDTPEIMKYFKTILMKSYGVKSDDGKRFVKNDEVREAFEQSEAYSEIFMELISDEKKAAAFINGMLPADLASEVAKNNTVALPTASE